DEHDTDSSCPPGTVAFGERWSFQTGADAIAPPAPLTVRKAVSAQAASPAPARVSALWRPHLCMASPVRVVQSPVSTRGAGVWPGSVVPPTAVQVPLAPQDTPVRLFCPA